MSTQSVQRASQDRVDKTAQAVRICWLMALLILFNIYPDKVGAYRTALDSSTVAPLLGAGFYAALPWLDAWWILGVALASVLLFFERWTKELRLAGLALDLLGIAVLWRLLTGSSLLLPVPGWPVPIWTLNTLLQIVLGLALLGRVVGAVRDLVRLLPAWVPEFSRQARS